MILQNKLEIPAIDQGICVRPALLDIFGGSAKTCTVVQAASGFGKTAVIATLAKKEKKKVHWYSLDENDNEIETFLCYLEQIWYEIDGIKAEVKGERKERLFALVLRAQNWESAEFLVLDNMEVITSADINKVLNTLVQNIRNRLFFVFLSSQDMPSWLLPILLNGDSVRYTQKELRLLPSEVVAWRQKDTGLSTKLLKSLAQELCGWPLGILYVCAFFQEKKGSVEQIDWDEILTSSLLRRYLDENIWANCTQEIRTFLLQTCMLDEMSWESCEAILTQDTKRKTYESVVSGCSFVSKKEEKDCYSYGKMFQKYLQSMLGLQERIAISKKAAQYYRKIHALKEMAHYAVLAKETNSIVSCVEQYGDTLLQEKGQQTLELMFGYLEQQEALFSPTVSGIAAQHFYYKEIYDKMENYLNAADSTFGKENKYGCYRSLYRALLHLEEEPMKYEKQINHDLFFLREEKLSLPYLTPKDCKKLDNLLKKEENKSLQCRKMLQVQSFGQFQVLALEDNKELAWRTRKGCELFAYLMDLRGKAIDRRSLICALWEEEIPSNAVAMLHNMIYNIRKELSRYQMEEIILYKDKKYSLNLEPIACDFDEIESLVHMVEHRDNKALKKSYEKFVSYWGSYLKDIDSSWAEEKQAYYDEIYKKGCWILANDFLQEKNYDTALILLKNILTLEPYAEEVMEKVLVVYGEKRSWKKIKICYRQFCDLLKNDLGITPEENIVQTYHRYIEQ